MASKGRSGWRYTRIREQMLAESDTCHICGHPDATDADHVIPLAVWPDQPLDPSMLRPAHGIDGCPWCPRKPDGRLRCCNQERGASLDIPHTVRQSRPW